MRTFLLLLPLFAFPLFAADGPDADHLAFLAGAWKGPMWGGEFVARYSTPEGGVVLSHSRLLVEGKEKFYEFEVFDAESMTPYPGGKKSVTFKLVRKEPNVAVFENLAHDFPQRLEYRRVSDVRLVITLTGAGGKREVFDLTRG